MSFNPQHALQPYWDLAVAPVQADGLAAALELGIFDMLATPHTPAQLAEVLSLRTVAHTKCAVSHTNANDNYYHCCIK